MLKSESKVKYHCVVRCKDVNEKMTLGTRIHERLVGNPDYIENRIILNVDEETNIHMYVFEDAEIDYKSMIQLALV